MSQSYVPVHKLFTIGFTGKPAAAFFNLLKTAAVRTVVDVRLHNTSQLAGFSKKEDLRYFLSEICNIGYVEARELAPEPELLKQYQNKKMSWDEYAESYVNLLSKRNVERSLDKTIMEDGCLLCSEHLPHKCHRRLAAEYLNSKWDAPLQITHLVK